MPYSEIITKDWPIIGVKFDSKIEVTVSDIDNFYDDLYKIVDARSGSFVTVVLPAENPKMPSVEVSRRFNERMVEMRTRYEGRLKGEFIVINGIMMKMLYKSLTLVIKELRGSVVTSTVQEAYNKALVLLK
ncbi:MAG: hypothetical protein MUC87_08155 [Bacteroidia bacterium]|jgi:hypothetical protein|nr:hypothetical protein [Bacteroidia bacterium]